MFGEDNREMVENAAVEPFSSVGKLVFSGEEFCTATLISPNFAVTAGRCIFRDRKQREDLENAVFYPGHAQDFSAGDRGEKTFATIDQVITETKIPQERVGLGYVILRLSRDLGNVYGYLTLEKEIKAEQKVTIVEYAVDRFATTAGRQDNCTLYYDSSAEAEFQYLAKHNGDTDTLGSFGAPLLSEDKNTVVGVHTGGIGELDTEEVVRLPSYDAALSNVAVAATTILARYEDIIDSDVRDNTRVKDNDSSSDRKARSGSTSASKDGAKTQDSATTDGATKAQEEKEEEHAGKTTLIICIALIGVVWAAIILVMRRMNI